MTRRRPAGHDRGSFTAEMAAGLPALVLLLLTGLTTINAVSTKAACLDAAREAALASRRQAPTGAEVVVVSDCELVRVTVRASVRALGTDLPAISVVATAVAAVEPGAPEPHP